MPAPKKHKPYPGCETGGRPEKYTKEFIEKEAEVLLTWIKDPNNVFYKKFALLRGYHPNRLSEFSEHNEKFSCALEMAKAWQEIKLAEGGLTNLYNPGTVKLCLSHNHGWKEKQEISGNATSPFALLLQQVDGSSKTVVPQDDN